MIYYIHVDGTAKYKRTKLQMTDYWIATDDIFILNLINQMFL